MNATPKVFISATSGDLATARKAAAQALITLGCLPVEQGHFPPDTRTVREMLRGKIADCHAILHIAGFRYGAEPSQRAEGEPRRSYTQMEFDMAVELGKPIYLFLPEEDFPFDDKGVGPEDEERRTLQLAHREALKKHGTVYTKIISETQLREKVRELQVNVEQLKEQIIAQQKGLGKFRRRLGIGLAAIVLILLGIGVVMRSMRKDVEKVAKESADTKEAINAHFKQTERIIDLLIAEKGKLLMEAKQKGDVGQWPQELLFSELCRRANVGEAEGLRAIAEAKASDDHLLRGKAALLEQDYATANSESAKAVEGGAALEAAGKAMQKKGRTQQIAGWSLKGQAEGAQAHIDAALIAFQKAADLTNKEADPLEWAGTQIWVGKLLGLKEKYDSAIALMEQVVPVYENRLGPESPRVSVALHNLAAFFYAVNRLAEAEPLMRRALKIDEKSYGPDDSAVASDLHNLAQLLQDTNRLVDAEPMYRRALEIDKKSFGPDHPEVARDLNGLAGLLRDTNRLVEAGPMYRRALEIDEKSFGPDHPTVAGDLNNLAQLLEDTNHLAEAQSMYRRAIEIYEKSDLAANSDVATVLDNLALLLAGANRLAEAEPLMQRALKIDEKSLGPEHPHVARDLNNLGRLLQDTNRLAEAEPLMRRALTIDEKSDVPNDANVATDLNSLAGVLYATNRLAEAEPLMRRALKISEKRFGPEDHKIVPELNNLAQLLQDTNRLLEAEPLMRRALKINDKALGPEHPDVALALSNLASLLEGTNRLAEAEPLSRRAVGILLSLMKQTGHSHPYFKGIVMNYASILEGLHSPEEEVNRKLAGLGPEVLKVWTEENSKKITITEVVPDGQAAKIGLKVGDMVLSYAGKAVGRMDMFMQTVKDTQGDGIDLEVQRGAEVMHFQVKGGRLGVRLEKR